MVEFSTNAPRTQHDPMNSLGDLAPSSRQHQAKSAGSKAPARPAKRSDQDYLDILLKGEKPKTGGKVTSKELTGKERVLLSQREVKAREVEVKAREAKVKARVEQELQARLDQHNEVASQVADYEKWHKRHRNASDQLCRMSGIPPLKQVQELRKIVDKNLKNLLKDAAPKTESGLVAVRLDSQEYKEAIASLPKRGKNYA